MHAYTVVDAFAAVPLEGNPVAAFFDAEDLSADLMQRIAREMNLSECTFVLPPRRGGDVRVRIFTPVNELPFAGHPLLGTALAVAERRGGADRLAVETARGTVPFTVQRTGPGTGRVGMRQPVPTWEPYEHVEGLLRALGVRRTTTPVEVYTNGPRHVLVGVESVAALSELAPDHRALAAYPDMAANCFAGSGQRWRNRMFSPAYGVVEDAATGSAAGPIALHLGRYGMAGYGEEVEIMQGVEMGRPARMLARVRGSAEDVGEIRVRGDAAVVAHGELHVRPRRTPVHPTEGRR